MKWKAPIKFDLSVMAIASCENSIENFNKSEIFDVDWSIENWV